MQLWLKAKSRKSRLPRQEEEQVLHLPLDGMYDRLLNFIKTLYQVQYISTSVYRYRLRSMYQCIYYYSYI